MSFLELVKKRQSTRGFTDKPVAREHIEQCIEAARLAPSACNSQPWSFIVVEGENLRKKIGRKAFSGIYRSNNFAKDAPVFIVAVTEVSTYIARLGGLIRNVKYNLIDIGVACEHLVLQAEELGIGSCWLGWFDDRRVKKTLDLSPKAHVDIIIALGYPKSPGLREKVRKPLDEMVTWI